jgi:hypothetical protein
LRKFLKEKNFLLSAVAVALNEFDDKGQFE